MAGGLLRLFDTALPGVEVAEGDKTAIFIGSDCDLLGETSIIRGSISRASAVNGSSLSFAANNVSAVFSIPLNVSDFCGIFSIPDLVGAIAFTVFVLGELFRLLLSFIVSFGIGISWMTIRTGIIGICSFTGAGNN
uniref:Uncharacterized protein n=1 Tax=Glossina brevipalpis TaxID=37001 RepID=A0A1A9W4G1_9MUSC